MINESFLKKPLSDLKEYLILGGILLTPFTFLGAMGGLCWMKHINIIKKVESRLIAFGDQGKVVGIYNESSSGPYGMSQRWTSLVLENENKDRITIDSIDIVQHHPIIGDVWKIARFGEDINLLKMEQKSVSNFGDCP